MEKAKSDSTIMLGDHVVLPRAMFVALMETHFRKQDYERDLEDLREEIAQEYEAAAETPAPSQVRLPHERFASPFPHAVPQGRAKAKLEEYERSMNERHDPAS